MCELKPEAVAGLSKSRSSKSKMASGLPLSSSLESWPSISSSTSLSPGHLAAPAFTAVRSNPPTAKDWGLLFLQNLAPDRILTSAPRCPAIFSGSVSPWVNPRPRTVVPLQLLPMVSPLSRWLLTPCQSRAELLLLLPTTSSRTFLCVLSKLLVRTSPISSREVVKRRPATWPERERQEATIIFFVLTWATYKWEELSCYCFTVHSFIIIWYLCS